MSVPPPPRIYRCGSLLLTVLLVGCPLPFRFTGDGAGIPPGRERNGSTITAPVTFSYTEASGTTGVIADGGSYSAAVATTITLTTTTANAVIYYTTDGSAISDLHAVDRFNASTGSLAVAAGQKRVITAVAVGPHMRPSPITTVEINSGYRVIYHANLSPIGATLRGSGTPGGASLSAGSAMPTDATRYVADVSRPDTVTVQAPTVDGVALQLTTSGAYETSTGAEVQLIGGGTYVFDGWYTTDVGGTTTSYAVGATFAMPAKQVNLYAKWRQRYTVRFDANSPCGSGSLPPLTPRSFIPGPTTKGSGSNISDEASLNVDGNMKPAPGAIDYLHDSLPTSFVAPPSLVDKTEYPWTPRSGTLGTNFNGPGNVGLISCGEQSSATPSGRKLHYYRFNGWNTIPVGSGGTSYTAGDPLSRNTTMTLYAVWDSMANTGSASGSYPD